VSKNMLNCGHCAKRIYIVRGRHFRAVSVKHLAHTISND
jgi:hypothetical protein